MSLRFTHKPVSTSFKDLAALGWSIGNILQRFKEEAGSTIGDEPRLYLNDKWTTLYNWSCHNTILSQPVERWVPPQIRVNGVHQGEYSNNGRTIITETLNNPIGVTENQTVSLSITTPARIELNAPIAIQNVSGSGLTMALGSETTRAETITTTVQRSFRIRIRVAPNERVAIFLVSIDINASRKYDVAYGLSREGKIGMDWGLGRNPKKWGFNLNYILRKPRATLTLTGTRKVEKRGIWLVHLYNGPEATTQSQAQLIDPETGEEIEAEVVQAGSFQEVEDKIIREESLLDVGGDTQVVQ